MGARFNYGKKESAGDNPYSKNFTERQKCIIGGLPIDGLKIQEITVIMRKAEKLDMPLVAEMVYETHEAFITGRTPPKYTLEEAKAILKDMTPWE